MAKVSSEQHVLDYFAEWALSNLEPFGLLRVELEVGYLSRSPAEWLTQMDASPPLEPIRKARRPHRWLSARPDPSGTSWRWVEVPVETGEELMRDLQTNEILRHSARGAVYVLSFRAVLAVASLLDGLSNIETFARSAEAREARCELVRTLVRHLRVAHEGAEPLLLVRSIAFAERISSFHPLPYTRISAEERDALAADLLIPMPASQFAR